MVELIDRNFHWSSTQASHKRIASHPPVYSSMNYFNCGFTIKLSRSFEIEDSIQHFYKGTLYIFLITENIFKLGHGKYLEKYLSCEKICPRSTLDKSLTIMIKGSSSHQSREHLPCHFTIQHAVDFAERANNFPQNDNGGLELSKHALPSSSSVLGPSSEINSLSSKTTNSGMPLA